MSSPNGAGDPHSGSGGAVGNVTCTPCVNQQLPARYSGPRSALSLVLMVVVLLAYIPGVVMVLARRHRHPLKSRSALLLVACNAQCLGAAALCLRGVLGEENMPCDLFLFATWFTKACSEGAFGARVIRTIAHYRSQMSVGRAAAALEESPSQRTGSERSLLGMDDRVRELTKPRGAVALLLLTCFPYALAYFVRALSSGGLYWNAGNVGCATSTDLDISGAYTVVYLLLIGAALLQLEEGNDAFDIKREIYLVLYIVAPLSALKALLHVFDSDVIVVNNDFVIVGVALLFVSLTLWKPVYSSFESRWSSLSLSAVVDLFGSLSPKSWAANVVSPAPRDAGRERRQRPPISVSSLEEFESALSTPDVFAFLSAYLATEFSAENAAFHSVTTRLLRRLEEHGSSSGERAESLKADGTVIMDTYIRPGAPQQVNLPSSVVQRYVDALNEWHPSVALPEAVEEAPLMQQHYQQFMEALRMCRQEIAKLILTDSFPRFLRSDSYGRYMSGEPRPVVNHSHGRAVAPVPGNNC